MTEKPLWKECLSLMNNSKLKNVLTEDDRMALAIIGIADLLDIASKRSEEYLVSPTIDVRDMT